MSRAALGITSTWGSHSQPPLLVKTGSPFPFSVKLVAHSSLQVEGAGPGCETLLSLQRNGVRSLVSSGKLERNSGSSG